MYEFYFSMCVPYGNLEFVLIVMYQMYIIMYAVLIPESYYVVFYICVVFTMVQFVT